MYLAGWTLPRDSVRVLSTSLCHPYDSAETRPRGSPSSELIVKAGVSGEAEVHPCLPSPPTWAGAVPHQGPCLRDPSAPWIPSSLSSSKAPVERIWMARKGPPKLAPTGTPGADACEVESQPQRQPPRPIHTPPGCFGSISSGPTRSPVCYVLTLLSSSPIET